MSVVEVVGPTCTVLAVPIWEFELNILILVISWFGSSGITGSTK